MTGPKNSFFWNLLRKPSTSVRFRVTLWFILVGTVPAIAIGTFALYQQTRALKKEAFQNQKNLLSQKLETLQKQLDEDQRGLKEIAGRSTLLNFMEARLVEDKEKVNFWQKPVQEDLARLATIRKRYSKIQMIGLNGQEIIRVDRDQNQSRIQPKHKLKNIKAHPWFKAISNFTKDQVAVLPDLTIKPGSQADVPHEPTIQFATLSLSPGGKKMGYLVLTSRLELLLKSFWEISAGKLMLVDATGHYLGRFNSALPTERTQTGSEGNFTEDYSLSLLQTINNNETGIIEDHPTEFLSYQRINFDTENPGRYWLGVYSRNKNQVLEPVDEFKKHFLQLEILILIAILFAAGIFGKYINEPIQILVAAAKAIRSGDLSQDKITCKAKDEFGVLADAFDAMLDRLRKNIHSIADASSTLNASSAEIATAVNDQSTIASQQSASLTEITSTLDELSKSSSQIADNSSAVVDNSANALNLSQMGSGTMEVLKEKMDGILDDNKVNIKNIIDLGNKSKEIGNIMEIINNIADQTKLIAFNAAIEASGAGQAGKRFGVVAVEIRRLADNVMESTNEIHSKIEEIQQAISQLVVVAEKGSDKILDGASLAAKTITELETLVERTKSTNDEAKQISLSTQQQMTATNQVLIALKEIQQGIQQSSASLKQTKAITTHLSESSEDLNNLMREFKINQSS